MARAPRPRTACAHCGKVALCSTVILEVAVCMACRLRYRRAPQSCPGCAEPRVLAFYNAQRRPACARCTGNAAVYACPECGREDSPFGRKCAPCTLRDRLTDLLADPTGRVHPQLQPLFETLMAGPRPQTTLYWLTRRSSRVDILREMALGEVEIAHAAFDQLPSNRAVNYLRDLLVATGILPPYQPTLERTARWLTDLLPSLPTEHADLVEPFARWHVLRRLRMLSAEQVTRSGIQNARATILATIRFLAWLDQQHLELESLSQPELDRYLVGRRGHGPIIRGFLDWAARTGKMPPLTVPVVPTSMPQVTMSDHARWRGVERLLHDDTIRLYTRIGGLFLLLFAQPLSRICRMRADQITQHPDGTVTVTFDDIPVQLPEVLDQLVIEHLHRRGQASYVSNADHWLFPGGLPGKHLATENIRAQLVASGIKPFDGRKAALFQLAAEIPTPVLAELLGFSDGTATRWAALAARDWSQYAAGRRASLAE